MLILPLLNELFPEMKFIHVIRDGRDISLGNPFVADNPYLDAFLSDRERRLPAEAKMILFWGRSNERAYAFGNSHLQNRYLMMRWEDMCDDPNSKCAELLKFTSINVSASEAIVRLVKRPDSIGRWKTFPSAIRSLVVEHGKPWLRLFQYA